MCVFIVMAVFTTSGTFMLLFLAALQSIDDSVNEAAALDGATEWRKFRYITVPMIRPTIFTVVTLGLIGTWQIFDQIYVGTKGSPSNTTLTPAFLSFNTSFNSNEWGVGAAIAFILFAIIIFFTLVTRLVTRNPDRVPRRRRFGPTQPLGIPDASRVASTEPGARGERPRRRARATRARAPAPAATAAVVRRPRPDRGRLPLPVPDRGRDVLQDGAGRDGQPAQPHSFTRSRRRRTGSSSRIRTSCSGSRTR